MSVVSVVMVVTVVVVTVVMVVVVTTVVVVAVVVRWGWGWCWLENMGWASDRIPIPLQRKSERKSTMRRVGRTGPNRLFATGAESRGCSPRVDLNRLRGRRWIMWWMVVLCENGRVTEPRRHRSPRPAQYFTVKLAFLAYLIHPRTKASGFPSSPSPTGPPHLRPHASDRPLHSTRHPADTRRARSRSTKPSSDHFSLRSKPPPTPSRPLRRHPSPTPRPATRHCKRSRLSPRRHHRRRV